MFSRPLARFAPALQRAQLFIKKSSSRHEQALLLMAGGLLAGGGLCKQIDCKTTSRGTFGAPVKTDGEVPQDKDLRIIGLDELRAHNNMDDGLWISFKGHVYDVTNFAKIHPGGPGRIMMMAGTDLQKYMDVSLVHFAWMLGL